MPKKLEKLRTTRCVLSSRKGFSLFELIIYVAIFGGIALFISYFLIAVIDGRGSTNAKFEVNQNLRYTGQRIRQLVYDSTSFSVSGTCPNNSLEVTKGTATTTLSLSGGVLNEVTSTSTVRITSDLVTATSTDGSTCIFTRIANPSPAKAALQFQLRISYNDNGNPKLQYFDEVQSSITQR